MDDPIGHGREDDFEGHQARVEAVFDLGARTDEEVCGGETEVRSQGEIYVGFGGKS